MRKVTPKEQVGVPTIQRYQENLIDKERFGADFDRVFSTVRAPSQHWMCPACDEHHYNQPIDMDQYRCNCGWSGNRDQLLTEENSNGKNVL